MKTDQYLILIRGLPGSGKTTTARRLVQKWERPWAIEPHYYKHLIHIETDEFWGPDYKFDKDQLTKAHNWCYGSTVKALLNGESVVVSNTFTTLMELAHYVQAAALMDISVLVYRCTGDKPSVHNVPEDVLQRIRERFEDVDGEVILDWYADIVLDFNAEEMT